MKKVVERKKKYMPGLFIPLLPVLKKNPQRNTKKIRAKDKRKTFNFKSPMLPRSSEN